MGRVFELRPYVNALAQLARCNRSELRKTAIGYVRDEQKAGRSGDAVAREIFKARLTIDQRAEAAQVEIRG